MDKIQLFQFLKERLAEHLEMPAHNIKEQDKFSMLGLNSAKATLLSVELSEKVGKKISPTVFYAYPIIQDLVDYLTGTPQKQAKKNDKAQKNMADAVAIVGMSCRFPQAPNLRIFWSLLEQEKNAITEIPTERWNIDDYYDEDSSLEGKIQTRYGGFVDGIDEFDPYFFDISPREASEMSPDQKICMELAWEAFAHAKIKLSDLSGTPTGVFIGNVWNDFAHLRIKKHAPINQHSAVGQSANIIANRISYAFGFQGPSLVIDSACSSSLYAVHLACQAIHNGDCEVALAGGVNIMLDPDTYVYMSKFGGLSPTGQCHTFDASADGYVRGEGAGMIVLKPLTKALKDGDRIFAVVRGSAVNNDGASNSLTAPNLEAQKDVLRVAYQRAGINPTDVHYIEAHGTGTKLGDPIEAEALAEVISKEKDEKKPLYLGSVKTNIGHLEGAAGIAGVIKVVLAMQKQKIPRSLNFHQPNPYIPFEEWKLQVASNPIDWKVEVGETRKAGVSAFGWGGTNAHIVLEEYTESKPEVLIVSAETEDKLFNLLKGIHSQFQDKSSLNLKSLCATYANSPSNGRHRIALKSESLPELQKKLREAMTDTEYSKYSIVPHHKEHKVAYIASPFGGQYIGMGIDLLENDKYFRKKFKECDYYFKKVAGWSLVDKLYSLTEGDLKSTKIMLPILSAFQMALAEQLEAYGIKPNVVIGHSIGEMAAAHIAGFLTTEDTMEVAHHYGRLIHSIAGPYAMAVVNRSAKLVKKDIEAFPSIGIAGISSETSCNIAGLIEEVDEFIKKLNNEGVKVAKINNNVPAHTFHVEVFLPEFQNSLLHIKPLVPKIPMYSTTLGKYLTWEDVTADYWCKNIRNTVLFSQGMKILLHDGYNTFVELHPHPVMKHSVNEAVSHMGKKATVHHALERDKEEMVTFQNLLMLLYLQGFDIEWSKRYSKYLVEEPHTDVEEHSITYEDVLVLPISAKTEQVAKDYAQAYLDFLQNKVGNTQKEMYDICATSALKKSLFDYRLCFTGKSKEEFAEKITDFLENPNAIVHGNLLKNKKMAFVFSGQGSQWLGMGRKLMQEFDVFRESIEECNRAFQKYTTDWVLLEELNASKENSLLEKISCVQPVLFAIQISLAKLWISWGIIPDSVVGHSMGEVAAAHIAGAIKLDDAAKIICRRSALMQTLSGKGTMMVVELAYDEATALCATYQNLEVAVNNSPNSCVIGGLNEAIDLLEADLTKQGVFCKKVNVDVASHTFQMQPIVAQLQEEFAMIMPNKSGMGVYSSVLGKQIEGDNMHGEYWVGNLRNQVRFAKTVEQMIIEDHAVFVEVSPHPVLSMPIKEIFSSLGKENECIVVASTLRNKPEEDVLMENLAELFAVGGKIRWHKFYRAAENFVELPNYPWNRERFTIQDRSEDLATYSLKRNDGSLGHPLLEQYIELADQTGIDVWETRLLAENIPFLNAYQANGMYQFPIAAYLEMLEAAIDEVYSKADYASHSLFVQKPVILHEGYTPILQLKVKYVNEKLSNFEIFVANLKDKAFKKRQWELVANGEIYIADTILTFPRELVKTLVRDSKEAFNKKSYYAYLEAYLNLKYDTEYQCVEKVWTIEGQENKRVIAQVVPTAKIRKEQSKYKLHPLLIGSCIRTLFTILPEEMLQDYENYEFYVASIEKMYITNQDEYQSPLWAECELLPYDKTKVAQDGVVGNFTLYDNLGNVIAKSYDFRLKRKVKEIDQPPLYELIWQKHTLPTLVSVPREAQTFLLFGQGDKLSKALTHDLQRAGHRVILVSPKFGFKVNYKENAIDSFHINPTNIQDYVSVLQVLSKEAISVKQVIYAWATQERVEIDTPIHDLEYKFSLHHISILHLLQTWSAQVPETPLHLHLLTIGAHAVDMTVRSLLAPALWGLMRSTRQEYPHWVCQSIDMSPTWDETEVQQCVYHVLYAHKELEVVLRNEACYFPRLQNVLEAHIPRNPIELQTEGTYIWVGSSDQLALAFIEWLASKGVKKLVWIHQTIPTDHSTGLFNYLKKNEVDLHLIQLDTLEEAQVEACLQDIRTTMPPIRGVFYAPIYNENVKLADVQPAMLEETWVENIHGAWNFHKYTQQDALDCFVLFSSCVTWLGSNGLKVLASSSLDALAHYRASHNLPALVINWGVVANNQETDMPYVQEFSAKLCPSFFEKVFVEGVTQMGIFHLLTKPSTPFYELVQLKNKAKEEVVVTIPTAQSKFEEWCAIEDRHKQMQWTEQLLREKTAFIIKSSPNKVNMNTPFKSLGVDSLMLVQLRNTLEETLDIKLPVSSFFSYPSIKEYAKFLDEQLCTAMPTPVGLQASAAPTTNVEADVKTPPAPEADLTSLSADELSKILDEELNMF